MLWSGVSVTECSLCYEVEFMLWSGIYVVEWN